MAFICLILFVDFSRIPTTTLHLEDFGVPGFVLLTFGRKILPDTKGMASIDWSC